MKIINTIISILKKLYYCLVMREEIFENDFCEEVDFDKLETKIQKKVKSFQILILIYVK